MIHLYPRVGPCTMGTTSPDGTIDRLARNILPSRLELISEKLIMSFCSCAYGAPMAAKARLLRLACRFSDFSSRYEPIDSTSMFVRRKQSIASEGVFTIGSFSLKDVLRSIGTPVSSPNLRMSFQ